MVAAGASTVMAAEIVEPAAVAVGGDRREEQQDSDGAGEHRQIVLHAREREKPRAPSWPVLRENSNFYRRRILQSPFSISIMSMKSIWTARIF